MEKSIDSAVETTRRDFGPRLRCQAHAEAGMRSIGVGALAPDTQSTLRQSIPSARPSPVATHIRMRSSFETQLPSPTLLANHFGRVVIILIAHAVVRSFLGDHDVVRMALAKTGGGDLDELRIVLQRVDIRRPYVSHRRAETAYKLENQI